MKLKSLLILMVMAAAGIWLYGFSTGASGRPERADEGQESPSPGPEPATYVKSIEIAPGSAYGSLMQDAGVPGGIAMAIYAASAEAYDLSRIRVGRSLELEYDLATDELVSLGYQIDTEEKLLVRRVEDGWAAERLRIPYETRIRTVDGEIESSLYASAIAQGLDEKAVVALAEVFQWTMDFSMDVRKGDAYRFILEERYLDGEYVMPGRVLAARYMNDGRERLAFLFEDGEGREAHYSEDGESLQKIFLKAPVAFKYISSGFTTGLRYVAAFNTSTGHRAIDYAAPTGTPVRAVGDGTVIMAGWNGPFGNFVSIRHNGTYTTNYAHMSRLAVKRGQKVSQGQTIGYVGSTGFSTGPHLHYEMVKNGVKINPLREEFPGGDPVPAERMDAFLETVARYRPML